MGVGGGGIYVDITLDAGYAALDREHVNLKHLLLFADGSDAEQMTGCEPKVVAASRRGITTSVVALGDGQRRARAWRSLSRLGNGRLLPHRGRDPGCPPSSHQETILAARSLEVSSRRPSSVDRGRALRP